MQKIIVASIESKKSKDGTKDFYVVHTADGGEMTTFDSKILSLGRGSVIEGEVKVAGKYVNLESFKVLEEVKSLPYQNGEDKEKFVNRRKALEESIEFLKGKPEVKSEHITQLAEIFEKWLGR